LRTKEKGKRTTENKQRKEKEIGRMKKRER
jgi:hypothetical protein